MERETIVNQSISQSVHCAGGKTQSLRVKEDKHTVVRTFDGVRVGIAAEIGDAHEDMVASASVEKLPGGIEYPCALPEHKTRFQDASSEELKGFSVLPAAKSLLSRLMDSFPNFAFSGPLLSLSERKHSYDNSKGTKYRYEANDVSVCAVIRAKNSANIMDAAYEARRDFFDESAVVADVGAMLGAYDRRVALPKKQLPVLVGEETAQFLLGELTAETCMSGAGLLSGKYREKSFSEYFRLYTDVSPAARDRVPFFDTEGTTLEGDKFYYIKDGVICGLATTRRSAKKYGLPLSGGAWAQLDDIPVPAFLGVGVGVTHTSLKDLVGGKAIYVAMTSGGDMTPDGTLALPVQLAYLYEGGRLVGRLPEFTIAGNLFDVFGGGYLGCAENDAFGYRRERLIAADFKVI